MRKVFVVLIALSLSGLFISCSDDNTSVTPQPSFEILTSELAQGYTCTPYSFTLEANGGTPPYTWSLDAGSSLPAGMTMSSDGKISGMLEAAGEYPISVVCVDAAGTPHQATRNLSLSVAVPSNPSIAIFFDGDATNCSAQTLAFSALDCHVFIMLDDSQVDCATATEFKISMVDQDGNPLGLGSQYAHSYVSFPDYVALTMGDPFSGIAVSFDRGQYSSFTGPIPVANFGLLLLEDMSNIAFKISGNPSAESDRPTIASCDAQRSIIEVDGRGAAVNFPESN
jgi:hypothetical protein